MKIVIAGGTGYLGRLLIRHFKKEKTNQIYVLTRNHVIDKENVHFLGWDGFSEGYWVNYLENVDVLINLTGKSVNCRYTIENKKEIYDSRINSTDLLCRVVQKLINPPKVFIQSSSATIYKYSEDDFMTENEGESGADFSMDVCKKWEATFNNYKFLKTKKIITRTSIVIGSKGGAFPIMKRLTNFGLGGTLGNGEQFISFITEEDYIRAISFLIKKPSGIYNLCVPNPIKNKSFQKILRQKLKIHFGLHSSEWLLKIGAKLIGTETELILKSRKVYPENLLLHGFKFITNKFEEYKMN